VNSEELATDNSSEVQFILREMFTDSYYIARFVLEPDGLKISHLVNGRGESVKNVAIGESLMPPDK